MRLSTVRSPVARAPCRTFPTAPRARTVQARRSTCAKAVSDAWKEYVPEFDEHWQVDEAVRGVMEQLQTLDAARTDVSSSSETAAQIQTAMQQQAAQSEADEQLSEQWAQQLDKQLAGDASYELMRQLLHASEVLSAFR